MSEKQKEGFKLPKMSVFQLFSLCVGIIGIQFAWSMQIALSSRVLEPLGASPFLFGLIWCAGPITGLLVQPIVGAMSDKTWTKIGRRRPFLLVGSVLGAIALVFFPFAPTLLIAALMIWIIDACVNVSQGPYRALVPDIVPSEQHAVANSYLNFAFGAGSVIALGVAPLLRFFDIQMSINQQYIMAALALVLTIFYTSLMIKEYKRDTNTNKEESKDGKRKKMPGLIHSFIVFGRCDREIHKVCGVQFLIWIGIMCMFIYLTPYIVHSIYHLPDMSTKQYKQIEHAYQAFSPIVANITEDQDRLDAARNQAMDVVLTVATPKINVPQVKRVLYSIADVDAVETLITEEMVENAKAELTSLKTANQQLNEILVAIINDKQAFDTEQAAELADVSRENKDYKEIADRVEEFQTYYATADNDSVERFTKLLSENPDLKNLLGAKNYEEKPTYKKYQILAETYKDIVENRALIENKLLLINYKTLQDKASVTPNGTLSQTDKTIVEPVVADMPETQVPAMVDSMQSVYDLKPVELSFFDLEKYALLKRVEEEATNTAQLALVAFNLMALILSIPLGYLCTKIGKKAVFSVSLAFLAVAFFFAPYISTPMGAILMMAAGGVAWATILSIPFAFLCDYMPQGEEGSIMGIFNMFIAGPQLISATFIGWLISQSPVNTVFGMTHNWAMAFQIASGCVVAAIIALQFVNEKSKGIGAVAGGGGH